VLFTHAALMLDAAPPEDLWADADADTDEAGNIIAQPSFYEQGFPAAALVSHVRVLLMLAQHLCHPTGGSRPQYKFYTRPQAGPRLVAALQLDLAVIWYISKGLELLPPGVQPSEALWQTLEMAIRGSNLGVMQQWLASYTHSALQLSHGRQGSGCAQGLSQAEVPPGALQALLQSPHPFTYALLLLTLHMYSAVLEQPAGTSAAAAAGVGAGAAAAASSQGGQHVSGTGGNSCTDATGSSSSSSSQEATSAAAWQRACALAKKVPPCLSRFCGSLGCSDKTALGAISYCVVEPQNIIVGPPLYISMLCAASQLRQTSHFRACVLHLQLVAAWLWWLAQLQQAAPQYVTDHSSTVFGSFGNIATTLGWITNTTVETGDTSDVHSNEPAPAHSTLQQPAVSPAQQQHGQKQQQQRQRQAPLQPYVDTMNDIPPGAAAIVMQEVLPELLQVLQSDPMQQVLLHTKQQQQQQMSPERAGSAAERFSNDPVGQMLFAAALCCFALLRQQHQQGQQHQQQQREQHQQQQREQQQHQEQGNRLRVSQAEPQTSSQAGQSSTHAPALPAAGAAAAPTSLQIGIRASAMSSTPPLLQQSVQLLRLWEIYVCSQHRQLQQQQQQHRAAAQSPRVLT
jgi:hypothetical protein